MPLEEDRALIVRILRFTRILLGHLIYRMPQEEQPRFTAAWEQQIRASLDVVIARVEAIEAENSPLWTRLVEAGLSGPSLDLKMHLLASALGERSSKALSSASEYLSGESRGCNSWSTPSERVEGVIRGTPPG